MIAEIIGSLLGTIVFFLLINYLLIKIVKLSEIRAVWYTYIIMIIYSGINILLSTDKEIWIIRAIVSILPVLIYLKFAKEDDSESEKLKLLPPDARINISELSVLSGIPKRKIKYYIFSKKISFQQDEENNYYFIKDPVIKELDNFK